MTEAGWTADKPNASGWYWNRINGTVGIALIMRRDCQLYAWLRFKDAWLSREGWLDYIHGEWLGPITPDSYQQGRVASLVAMKDYLETRADIVEGAALRELLAGNSVKESNERSALAEIHAMQSVIRDLEAQQAQDEKGVGDGN